MISGLGDRILGIEHGEVGEALITSTFGLTNMESRWMMGVMIIGCLKESAEGERRVALVPAVLETLTKTGATVMIEAGAGGEAGFSDPAYREKGGRVADRDEVLTKADVLCVVQADRPELFIEGKTLIGFAEPLSALEAVESAATAGVTVFSMELMPRITRAQTMDALSSQATVAGYKAVVLAMQRLGRMFPMMMTAAGTLAPAKVFVIGAGVAGLQAIATARRNGGVVTGYDIRPTVKEQVESLGARFLEIELASTDAEDEGGYAKAMDEAFYRHQREALSKAVAESNVVITTAAVPGKQSPELITGEMVEAMASGAVIIDLAAQRGGNCALTQADETVTTDYGVTILGPTDLAATVPHHASQMYAKNITTFLTTLIKDGELTIDLDDQITCSTLVTHEGTIVNERVREHFDLERQHIETKTVS